MKLGEHFKLCCIGLCLLFIASCSEGESESPEAGVYNVDPVFEPYVQDYIREAAQRGRTVDFTKTGLRIQFSEFPLNGAAGLCRLGRYDIEIDKANWFRFSERFRSYLLFHELGHCDLNRLHRNDKFNDTSWKSIMRGDPFQGIDNRIPVPYFGFRKKYYIDELFDPQISQPEWENVSFSYNQSDFSSPILSIDSLNRLNEGLSEVSDNYSFEVIFELVNDPGTITKLDWGISGGNYYVQIFPGWGYYIGVNFDGIDNDLFYSNNINLVGGKEIGKITVRQSDGFTQIFVNEEFVFHLDPQQNLGQVKLAATEGSQINTSFLINSFKVGVLD